jgi:hypothetical protein
MKSRITVLVAAMAVGGCTSTADESAPAPTLDVPEPILGGIVPKAVQDDCLAGLVGMNVCDPEYWMAESACLFDWCFFELGYDLHIATDCGNAGYEMGQAICAAVEDEKALCESVGCVY